MFGPVISAGFPPKKNCSFGSFAIDWLVDEELLSSPSAIGSFAIDWLVDEELLSSPSAIDLRFRSLLIFLFFDEEEVLRFIRYWLVDEELLSGPSAVDIWRRRGSLVSVRYCF